MCVCLEVNRVDEKLWRENGNETLLEYVWSDGDERK